MRAAKALASLHIYADLPEPSLLADGTCTKILIAGPYDNWSCEFGMYTLTYLCFSSSRSVSTDVRSVKSQQMK